MTETVEEALAAAAPKHALVMCADPHAVREDFHRAMSKTSLSANSSVLRPSGLGRMGRS